MTAATNLLWPEITVLERGWLSANNYLFQGPEGTALVDTGYCTHAAQTLALVQRCLDGKPLDRILNTHLHSDHCGGNAALQAAYPGVQTWIAPGSADHVRQWNPVALGYISTGQTCPRFGFDTLLQPGTEITLGGRPWQVHAAPGHDPHSVILFEPQKRILISADALWERGFGVVFPELDGESAFQAVDDTLELINSLKPKLIMPGHGAIFDNPMKSLEAAKNIIHQLMKDKDKNTIYALKVLISFKILQNEKISKTDLTHWMSNTPIIKKYEHMLDTHWIDSKLNIT